MDFLIELVVNPKEFKEVFKDTLFISLDEIIKTIKNKKSN